MTLLRRLWVQCRMGLSVGQAVPSTAPHSASSLREILRLLASISSGHITIETECCTHIP